MPLGALADLAAAVGEPLGGGDGETDVGRAVLGALHLGRLAEAPHDLDGVQMLTIVAHGVTPVGG